jgi:ppGpp synthetase/RelA/SpoT-type nucleotidyltranferase
VALINDFIARYRKEYDFYDQAARLAAQALETDLQAAGIRSRITSRAKAVPRLEAKVHQRALAKAYNSVDAIYDDIVDLAGARVELYFPGQQSQVENNIRDLFRVIGEPKKFPNPLPNNARKSRFSGYSATYYRVYLREASLSDAQKRYAEAPVEIQVASFLCTPGRRSTTTLHINPYKENYPEDEYAILDELNGLVIAGEIALARMSHQHCHPRVVFHAGPLSAGPTL